MAIRTIVTYPDKRLKQVSKPVVSFDEELHTLLDDMYETMLAKNGVGLAAIQIGAPKRVLIICIPDEEGNQSKEDILEVINPEIYDEEGSVKSNEGCLSVPGYYDDVTRFEKIKIRFQDRNGNTVEMEPDGFLSIAFQHEHDHLLGRLFIDKLPILKRKKFEKEFKARLKEKKAS